MRDTVKANESKMSRPEVEKLSLGWICSFCENNVCSADWISMMVGERAGQNRFRPFLPSHSLQFIEKKAPRKKKFQQEISGNDYQIIALVDSGYSRTHAN
jgi:hypothetical protein